MHQSKIQSDKREMGMQKAQNIYYLLIQGGMKNHNFLLIILTMCRGVSEYGMGLECLLMI